MKTKTIAICVAVAAIVLTAVNITAVKAQQFNNPNLNFTAERVSISSFSLWRYADSGLQVIKVKDTKDGVNCYVVEGGLDDNAGNIACVKVQ